MSLAASGNKDLNAWKEYREKMKQTEIVAFVFYLSLADGKGKRK